VSLAQYGCGEWDGGGIPAWLLAKPGLEIRTNNSVYLEAVDNWWTALYAMAKAENVLYEDGGPVVMVQMENEVRGWRGEGGVSVGEPVLWSWAPRACGA
jgi:beta-galactosidase GanA